jgi:four helix bundle protein
MKIRRFENLIAWQRAQDLAVGVFNTFGDSRDWTFRDQIWRAVISVSNNIAEGFDRGTDADFIRFLNIACSSLHEVKSMIYLAERVRYLNATQKQQFIQQTEEVSRIILGLINSLKS